MSAGLEVSDLSVWYGKVQALYGATIEVKPGTIVTIIGPNGAGKTTLLMALIGALRSKGRISYDGQFIEHLEVEQRVERGIGLVPEHRELFGDMSVEENLLLGAFSRRDSRDVRKRDLEDVYKRFPILKERRRQLAKSLSGGQRQMVAIGRALMGRPRLLMLDEPSLGLAPLIVREMFHIINNLRETGVSVLLIEQNARAALEIADFGYVLETGSVAMSGTGPELMQNAQLIDAYLGTDKQKSRS